MNFPLCGLAMRRFSHIFCLAVLFFSSFGLNFCFSDQNSSSESRDSIPEFEIWQPTIEEPYLEQNSQLPRSENRRFTHIGIKYGNWHDPTRNRTVPVKIYYPFGLTKPSPVVVFSHGLGGSYDHCDYLGKKWASTGMISVHIQHPGGDNNVWKNKVRPIKELKEVYPMFSSGRIHANDVRFVIDQLEIFARTDQNLGQFMDLNRLAVGGYNLGGLAALLLAGQRPPDHGSYLYDERVKAIIVMGPPVYANFRNAFETFNPIQIPVLFFTGTKDDGIVGETKAPQRRIPFDHIFFSDTFLITYQETDHMIYSGHVLSIRGKDDQKYQTNMANVSLLFLQAYLTEDSEAKQHFCGDAFGQLIGNLGQMERRIAPKTE